jgi:AAA-like domain
VVKAVLGTGAKQERLSVRYLDDDLLLSETHAWTWLKLPSVPYEFLQADARRAYVDQFALALSALVTGNEPVEMHLRVVFRDFPVADWYAQLLERADGYGPAPGWQAYADQMADHMEHSGFLAKEVYLGVNLGQRSVSDTTKFDPWDILGPLKKIVRGTENVLASLDDTISDSELARWRAKADDVRRSLQGSHLRAVTASANEVAWLISKPLWPTMDPPAPTSTPGNQWDRGSLNSLVDTTITNGRRYLQVDQMADDGTIVPGYTATLCFSRFPDVLVFPDQEPWIHFAATLAFPVEFSSRFLVVPANKVAKDVSRKLADAKDQSAHIAETGAGVPLAVQEQLNTATLLEYTVTKDRVPWIYGRHRLIVTADSPEQLAARCKTTIEHYRDLSIDVVWPTAEQFDLLCEALPGDKVRSRAYYQRQDLRLLGGGMTTASSEVGDQPSGGRGWSGPLVGDTTSRVRHPVFFSPHLGIALNNPPGVAITGSPGGGKSFFAFTLAYQMAMQGVWTIYIDPKADAKPIVNLPGLGEPKLFDLRAGNDGMLDPFSLGDTRSESTLLALETMRLLLGGNLTEDREEALVLAIEQVAGEPSPSLGKVVDLLSANQTSAGARNLGAVLRTIRELPFARLCFANQGGAKIRPEDGLTIITLLGLDLPAANANTDDYSYENRLAVSVMYLLTRYARRLMLNLDKSHPKAICIDEAWAITSTPQGAKLIPEVARMGRSHNTALVLVSQNAGDLMEESVTNSISTKFAFRSKTAGEIKDVLELLGIADTEPHRQAVRDLNNGECLVQDIFGRVARVQIDPWNAQMREAFDTNPETRGKGQSSPGEG